MGNCRNAENPHDNYRQRIFFLVLQQLESSLLVHYNHLLLRSVDQIIGLQSTFLTLFPTNTLKFTLSLIPTHTHITQKQQQKITLNLLHFPKYLTLFFYITYSPLYCTSLTF